MSDRVVMDSKTRLWLHTTEACIERVSYMGRNRTEDEMEDLRRWCRCEGIEMIITVEASRAMQVVDTDRRARRTDALLRRSLQPA